MNRGLIHATEVRMDVLSKEKVSRIRELNDNFRTQFLGGAIMLTRGVSLLPEETRAAVLKKIREFDAFDDGNDPHKEHDFGAVDHDGQRYFFKIDYYNPKMDGHSDDPTDTGITRRVMVIMLAEEY